MVNGKVGKFTCISYIFEERGIVVLLQFEVIKWHLPKFTLQH